METIAIASRYVDALLSRDPSDVPFAAEVTRISGGTARSTSAEELREVIRNEPPLTMGRHRWVASPSEAAVFYGLHADVGIREPAPASVGERFVIRDGLITEIEIVVAEGGWIDPWNAEDAPDGAAVQQAAATYLAALVSHDPAAVRFASDVTRVENGKDAGAGAERLRASLQSDVMDAVRGTSNSRWIDAGSSVAVFYDLHTEFGGSTQMFRVAERFAGDRGAIAEIEAVFAPIDGGRPQETTG